MMKFGTRAAEAPTNTGGDYLRYFKEKETRLRFLDEMADWTEVWMHWSVGKSRSYPCTGDRGTCPGCAQENERESKASKRYIVNAQNEGYVNAWIIPGSLWEDLDRFSDRDEGTIRARDYSIIKKSTDAGVRYSVDKEERDSIDLEPWIKGKKDVQQMLMDVFVEVWGYIPGEDSNEAESQARKAVTLAPPATKPTSAPGWPKDDDLPPTEPQAEKAAPEEEKEVSEDDLRAMSAPQIKALFAQCGLEAPETDDSNVLADTLIAALS